MSQAIGLSRYAALVTRHDDAYILRIPELLLTVTAGELREGYEHLRRRQAELVELARNMGALDELPAPTELPPMRSIFAQPSEIDPDVVPIKRV